MPAENDVIAKAMQTLALGQVREARRLLKQAAQADHLVATNLYATFVEHGLGGKPNVAKALVWLEKAALLGDAAACVRVAEWYLARGDSAKARLVAARSQTAVGLLIVLRIDARHRSVRATRLAKMLLRATVSRRYEFKGAEAEELDRLRIEYSRRNPMEPSRRL